MDRREMFGLLGTLGAGFPLLAADHGGKKDGPVGSSPLAGGHAHFCGIHMVKKDPKVQIVTQHYCAAHSGDGDDLFQCILFDSNKPNAKLLGVEYIISDKVYRTLPDAEKVYWHAHTYEVLGGGLIAPGMTPEDESKFMKMILTTWGKAWHTWPDPATAVPTGEPMLIWSLMGDGQVDEKVLAERDKKFKVDTAKVRETREKEFGLEAPKVSPPKDMNAIGRQWTDIGEDKPTKKK